MRNWLLLGVVFGLIFSSVNPAMLTEGEARQHFVDSAIVLQFHNGPSASDNVTGSFILIISLAGNGTLSNVTIEHSQDNSNWSELTTLTSSPWIYSWDTTAHSNGTWYLRTFGYDSSVNNSTTITETGAFNIVNQIPLITQFSLADSEYGSGMGPTDRAWYTSATNSTLEFSWSASDDDLSYATLTNVPGTGSPADDGPSAINHGWSWSPGDLSEGTWNPRITVYDNSGLSASQTIYMGIDRSGPTIGTPVLASGATWADSATISVSGLGSAGGDGSGSGVEHYEWRIEGNGNWTNIGSTGSASITLTEGQHILEFRGIDNVGNIGSAVNSSIGIDTTNPLGGTWMVDELTTSRIGAANVSFSATDSGSGVDLAASGIEFGFDSNGAGSTPDVTGAWLDLGSGGLSGAVSLTSWSTKSHQYLALRATVEDEAGNTFVGQPAFFQILPGLDFGWNTSSIDIDRFIVRPGNDAVVWINSSIESNEIYNGGVIVALQTAPADRDSSVTWTTQDTRALGAGTLSDMSEDILWNYTVTAEGQWDLRLIIDPDGLIDERDEGNNDHYLVVTGVTTQLVAVVPSFAPSLLAIIIVGLGISWLMRRNNSLTVAENETEEASN
ncbi:MAG: hypothetical protein HOE92_07980 [Euryarchaeota archaeon]|jgi:hypothetical protein|nr:hypothetical protein [Euryarchaeota archaeon]MBT4406381.1 hypothetical protein [Euryarchaeota archaeon]MBT6644687.1 hypothetical protein [Euryarchaeota archaeon]